MLLRHTNETVAGRNSLTVNPAKTCQPIGDDIPQICEKAREKGFIPDGKYVIHANTPSCILDPFWLTVFWLKQSINQNMGQDALIQTERSPTSLSLELQSEEEVVKATKLPTNYFREPHYFVCNSFRMQGDPQGVCNKKGAIDLLQYLEEEIIDRGLDAQVSSTGCLKVCDRGQALGRK